MNEEKLIGYIKGENISETEVIEILDWIDSSPENQKRYNQLKNVWVVTGLDSPDQVLVPAFVFPRNKRLSFQQKSFAPVLKYAAVFVLAFVLGSLSLYFVNRSGQDQLTTLYNTIDVPFGERSQITLYDGTKIWLNSGTKFTYPVFFGRNSREVQIEGEAFFDVAKNPDRPFVVTAGQLKVEVLGTQFNVCAYADDAEFSATLEEGAINAVNIKSGRSVTLKPGEQLVLNRTTNNLSLQRVNTELYTSWKENLLKFEDAPFEDVIKKMERWYDVKITVDAKINTQERYTMTIKTESLREMLQLVSKTTRMNYEIKENNVQIINP